MQLENSNIESQCDDVIIELIRRHEQCFLDLLTDANSHLSEKFSGKVCKIEKSPKRYFATGQTDIGVVLESGLKKIHILIENKVMSPFTELQPERYHEEVRGLNQNLSQLLSQLFLARKNIFVKVRKFTNLTSHFPMRT